jgi:hypothetical protein
VGREEGRGVVELGTEALWGEARRAGQGPPLQRAEELVEFVGGVEVGFQVAGGEAFAEIV